MFGTGKYILLSTSSIWENSSHWWI